MSIWKSPRWKKFLWRDWRTHRPDLVWFDDIDTHKNTKNPELIEADIKKDKEHLLKAIRVIEPLADAWEEAFFKKPVIKSIAPPSNSKIAGTYNFVSGNSIAGNISAELKLPVQQKPTENPENPTLPPKLKMDLKG